MKKQHFLKQIGPFYRFRWTFGQQLARIMLAALAFGAALAPGGRALAEGDQVQHVVAPGDNLFRLAQRYGVPLRALIEANGIASPDYVRVGQVLRIPVVGGEVAPGASVAAPATQGEAAAPEQTEGVRFHTMAPGESLFRIALRYGVSVSALARANSLTNPNVVTAGRTLVIPGAHALGQGATGGDDEEQDRPAALPLLAAPASAIAAPAPSEVAGVDFSPAPWFRLTHYCLPGQMASGRTVYLGAVAADPSVFALGTRLLIEEYGFFTVEDRFAWDGREARLDVWVPTCYAAVQRGVVYRRVFVILPR